MDKLHIITPVKDSIDLTLETIQSVMGSVIHTPFTYTIYNDRSTPENSARLQEAATTYGFELVNIAELTDNPSPNYGLVLQIAQVKALSERAGLLIIESDVVVDPESIQRLFDAAIERTNCGIAASVTVDSEGVINYPYLYAKKRKSGAYVEKKHLSFCCSLLTYQLLKGIDFALLDPNKHWYDTTISRQSREIGHTNYLFTNIPVLHRPHSSRPWKLLKYTNPWKYYWIKFTKGFDKI